jgi:hypothetical protein
MFSGAFLVAAMLQSSASAQIMSYTQDFDALTPSGTVLSDEGWEFFGDNAGLGGYGGAAPGAGPQISALASDGAGNQYINFYANYDNGGVHGNPALKEAMSLFVNQPFTAADAALAETWTFNFAFAINPEFPLTPGVETGAFIRVFDPAYNLLAEQTFDTSGGTSAFVSESLSQTFDAAWTDGGFVQFGFNNLVGQYHGSGVFYDSVSFSNAAGPVLLGDVDLSGTVDFLDITPFIGVLSGGTFQAEADCDGSGSVTFLDITPFIGILSGSTGT